MGIKLVKGNGISSKAEDKKVKELEERVKELEKKLNDKKKKHPYSVIFNGYERVLSKEDYETMEEHLHHL